MSARRPYDYVHTQSLTCVLLNVNYCVRVHFCALAVFSVGMYKQFLGPFEPIHDFLPFFTNFMVIPVIWNTHVERP